ncbi:phage-related protein/SLT domain-containing protein [Staphylococcus caledonicus]
MIKGEKAGTALRTMFTNLAKPTKAMKDKMEELGISITDSNGKMLPMRDVMGQLRDKFKGLSKDQQASAAATIFGKEAMSGALAVINASDEDYKKLTKSIDNSTGASKRMSDEMEGGIGGSIRKMKSAIESMAISIGDVLAPHIRKAADFLAMLADKFTNMPGWVKTGVVGLGIFAAALGPLILTTGAFTAALGSIMTTIGPVMTGITKAGGLMNFLGTKAPFAAKGLTLVGGAFKFMLGPVGLAIAAIVAIGTAFVIAYKKSETFRNIINAVINPVVNAFKNLRNTAEVVFNALKNLFSGNALPTVDILSKIMPKATAIKVTATLMQIRQVFIDVFNAIWQFGQDIGLKLGQFWNQNGATIMQAVTNIWNTIVTVFTEVKNFLWPILQELGGVVKTVFMNVIVPAVKIGMQIIWGVMKFLWPLIKTLVVDTWNNIKNIINGALDIILGIVKIFSGLFTGQWKQVWNGIKQVFSGALTLIWNLIQLWFIGKILKVVKVFGGFFKSIISKAFNGAKTVIGTVLKFIWSIISTIFKRILSITRSIFGAVLKFIRFIFNSIKNFISKIVKAIYNNVKKWFTSVWNVTKAIFGKLKNWVIKLWSSIKNKVVGFAKGLYNSVKNRWNALWSVTKSIFNRLKNWVVKLWNSLKNKVVGLVKNLIRNVKIRWLKLKKDTIVIFTSVKNWLSKTWRSIKNKVTDLAKSLWNGVKRIWNSLKSGTHNIFSKVSSSLKNTWKGIKNSVVDTVKTLWSKVKGTFSNMRDGLKNIIGKIKGHIGGMVKSVKEGLNKLIKGVNWVGDKLGMGKQMIKPIKLSTGTANARRYVSNGKINQDTMAVVGDKGRGNGEGGFRNETITYPNGKSIITPGTDTLAYLPKGSSVASGAQTQAMFSEGTLPKFNIGSLLSGGKKPKNHKKDDHLAGDVIGKAGALAGKVVSGGKAIVSDTLKKAGSIAGKSAGWLKDKVGDVMDWIDKPKKLFDKVLDAFGVNMDGFGISKSAEIPFKMMKGMFKKLKKGAIDTIKGWFEDQAGDGGYIDLSKGINFGFARTAAEAAAQGYPFPRAHHGLDINYKYDKVYSTLAGKATGSTGWNGGFGRNMWIRTKNGIEAIYGHLSKLAFSGTKQVKPGDYLGVSGGDPSRDGVNAGSSTGPHLHYEMRWNGQPKDPTNWLKKNNGGGKSGGKQAPSKWRSTIEKAAKRMKVNPSNAQINGIIAQIQRESGGDAGITQGNIGDINNLRGTPAQGLLQYVPSTFRSYAVKGHNNIKSGYDQLLAFFNNSNWANDIQYGRSGWGPRGSRRFATGGLIKNAGWYNLAEGGYPEWVIPTDPNRRTDAMKLLALAAKDIQGSKASGNKRPNNFSKAKTTTTRQDNGGLERKLDALIGLMSKLVQSNDTIANKDYTVELDGRELNRSNNREQALNDATRLLGRL